MTHLLAFTMLAGFNAGDVPSEPALRAAVGKWQKEVCFCSTYRLETGFAKSKEGALLGQMDRGLGKILHAESGIFDKPARAVQAWGTFNKCGKSVLHTFDAGKAGILYKKGDFTLEPIVELTNGSLGCVYFPRRWELRGEDARVASIRRWEAGPGKPWAGGRMTSRSLNPLNPMWADEAQPFADLEITGILRLDDESFEVTCRGRKAIEMQPSRLTSTRRRRIVFQESKGPPVVRRIEETVERFSPDAPTEILGRDEFYAILDDFRECPGGLVARSVRFVAMQQADAIRLREWRSEDLGMRTPSEADFAVEIPEDVRVRGLKTGYGTGKDRSIRLDGIGVGDLEESPPVPRRPPALVNPTKLNGLLRSWLAGIAAFALIFARYRRPVRSTSPR